MEQRVLSCQARSPAEPHSGYINHNLRSMGKISKVSRIVLESVAVQQRAVGCLVRTTIPYRIVDCESKCHPCSQKRISSWMTTF
jgi:hypothetical protein